MSVVLRLADLNDAKLLSELGIISFTEAFGKDNSEEDIKIYFLEAFDEDKIKNELRDKEVTYIIALGENNEAVGYAKLNRNEHPGELNGIASVQLQRIYVRQKVKGQKIGALLMRKCIDIAKKDNRNVLWLTVWQENKEAINFYYKWGFEICGYKQFKIGNKIDDDFMMKKELSVKY